MGGSNDQFNITINGVGPFLITLGSQNTPNKIAQKIQQEVRNITHANIEIRSAFLGFTCYYSGNSYVLESGTGGTSSSV